MDLNKQVLEIMEKQLAEGIIEKAISEKLSEGINKAVDDMFGHWGEATKLVKGKIEEVMIPQLERYDYSQHIVKLDSVLTDIMKATTTENKKILENFKLFMIQPEAKVIKLSELFKKYTEYLGANVDTEKLEVVTDDEAPYYEGFEASYEVERNKSRDWSKFQYATLVFENEHDDEMSYQLQLSKWGDDEKWDIRFDQRADLTSLRRVNKFEILLMNLVQCGVDLELDEQWGCSEVEVTQEPECSVEYR